MTIIKKAGILSLLFVILLSACREDINIENETTILPIPEVIVNASLAGLVTDQAGNAIADALILVGNNNTTTDDNGAFTLENIPMNQEGALIKIKKAGYFDGFRLVNASLNERSTTKIVLRTKSLLGKVSSTSEIALSTPEGFSVSIPASSIELETGESYSGEVNVYGTWFDPSDVNILGEMPGDLRAVSSENEFRQLQTYGMIGVELEATSGQPLQISEGKSAEIRLPLPASLSGSAPSTIPLWHFDENTGYWMEEGQARLEGNEYVGEVSHFSFWNCDVPFPLIHLTGNVFDQNMAPVAGAHITIERNEGYAGYGTTDENGTFSGKVPKDEVLTISIRNECWDVVYTAEIGPFSEDTVLDPIVISGSINLITLNGNLENCDGEPVVQGYIIVDYGSGYYTVFIDENSAFSTTLLICDANEISVAGVDLVAGLQSDYVTYDVPGSGELDLGVITACDAELDMYFHYQFNNAEVNYTGDIYVSVFPDTLQSMVYDFYISGFPNNPGMPNQISSISINDVDFTDVNNPAWLNLIGYLDPMTTVALTCQQSDCADIEVVFEEYGTNSGDIVKGSFSGSLNGFNGEIINVQGEFKGPIK